jgi:hypothetical protein
MTDTPIELASGEEMHDLHIVLTDRVTRVFGQLADAKNVPLRDATVILFPVDRERWYETSRRMRAVRPDQRGQWEVKGLPAGEYLAVALDYVEDAAWNDPDYLESLREYGRTVTIREGAAQSVSLELTIPRS